MVDNYIDKGIESEIRSAYDELHFSKEAKERMTEVLIADALSLKNNTNGGRKNMKRFSIKKVAILTAACVTVLGGTALAASGRIVSVSSSGTYQEYTSYNEVEKVEKWAGFDVVAPQHFEAGYDFAAISRVNNSGYYEGGSDAGNWKSIDIDYENADGKRISIYAEEFDTLTRDRASLSEHVTDTRDIAGTAVYFNRMENLFVPSEDYVTEEQQKRMDEDPYHYNIGIGSEEVEEVVSVSASFEKDGIWYEMFTFEDVDFDTLASMAGEIIAQ
ncbi:MAG: hypothetical protein IJ608_03445 [Lachnospiraceae bacterium]|nr:hypothetical protein [Lachnospiraceae bacterium]